MPRITTRGVAFRLCSMTTIGVGYKWFATIIKYRNDIVSHAPKAQHIPAQRWSLS